MQWVFIKITVRVSFISVCFLEVTHGEASKKSVGCAGECGVFPDNRKTSGEFAPPLGKQSASRDDFCFLCGLGNLSDVIHNETIGGVHGRCTFSVLSPRDVVESPSRMCSQRRLFLGLNIESVLCQVRSC